MYLGDWFADGRLLGRLFRRILDLLHLSAATQQSHLYATVSVSLALPDVHGEREQPAEERRYRESTDDERP